jgi:hypothetical protein
MLRAPRSTRRTVVVGKRLDGGFTPRLNQSGVADHSKNDMFLWYQYPK